MDLPVLQAGFNRLRSGGIVGENQGQSVDFIHHRLKGMLRLSEKGEAVLVQLIAYAGFYDVGDDDSQREEKSDDQQKQRQQLPSEKADPK